AGTPQAVFDVSAAAGVQANDNAVNPVDTLRSHPVGTGVPATITTDGGGTAILGTDGSFSYTPAAGFTGRDHFQYVDTEISTSGGTLGTSAAAATVEIAVYAPT